MECSQQITKHEGGTRTGTVSPHESPLIITLDQEVPIGQTRSFLKLNCGLKLFPLNPSILLPVHRCQTCKRSETLFICSSLLLYICFICLIPSWCHLLRGSRWTHTLSCSLTHLAVPYLFASSSPGALNTGGFILARTLLFLVSL